MAERRTTWTQKNRRDEAADARSTDRAKCRNLLGRTNRDWWPDALQLDILTEQGKSANPYGEDFRLCRGVPTRSITMP